MPDGPPGYANFIFNAEVLPPSPSALSTDRVIIRKAGHEYNLWVRVDAVWLYLSLRTCREFAVFLLACAFHGPAEDITLMLVHPKSDIRRIIVGARKLSHADLPVGLSMVPFALNYYPSETSKHPWLHDCCTHDLPLLALSNLDDCAITEEQWSGPDTIRIWPNPGTIRLAELLLNAGCSWNDVREYQLEGDAGYRGVAPMSAELRIFLPGSDGWLYDGDDVPAY